MHNCCIAPGKYREMHGQKGRRDPKEERAINPLNTGTKSVYNPGEQAWTSKLQSNRMRIAGSSSPYRHFRARVSQGKTEAEAKKNIAEAIELHLGALAGDGIPVQGAPLR